MYPDVSLSPLRCLMFLTPSFRPSTRFCRHPRYKENATACNQSQQRGMIHGLNKVEQAVTPSHKKNADRWMSRLNKKKMEACYKRKPIDHAVSPTLRTQSLFLSFKYKMLQPWSVFKRHTLMKAAAAWWAQFLAGRKCVTSAVKFGDKK